MRLLERKDNGGLSLTKDIASDEHQPYAILSHTWGHDDDEVSFKDLTNGSGKTKAGYRKILFCAEQAARDGLQYCWVDTCCIDKLNGPELSEAINSMFRWYRNAAKCYVYLSDVSTENHDPAVLSLQTWQSAFRESRWFTRGWTLQELIAPHSVEFFSSNWKRLGDKKSLERQLHEITGIAIPALQGTTLSAFSVKERMSWVETRRTKREEDKVYSLLGIFDIHLPLIYGEGAKHALGRLEEVLGSRLRKHQRDELSIAMQSTSNCLRKHQRDELSIAMQSTSNPTKRLKALPNQPCSVPPCQDLTFRDPAPVFDAENSGFDDNLSQSGKELVTRISHNVDATKQSLIEQLYFAKIDERLTNLTAAQGTTCRWFLAKPEYIRWHDREQYQNHGGFLWIKGNPGTGKSTLMKLLFEEAKQNTKNDPSQITLSFFFLARGTVEEKSTTGLYRSILHQLFEKAIELRDSLDWMTPDGARGIRRNGWDEEALKKTLTRAVQNLRSRSLIIFVDALDECDQSQAARMVGFFEDLCDHAADAQVRLQICFSSRHYPTVVIQKGIEVTLEDEIGHTEDIKQYIKSKLRLGKSKQAESLRSEILDKSSGIFLWVVLVIDIFNSEYPNKSISITKIRERLKEIPQKLTDLFEMILKRDGENLEQLQLCLTWILLAARPLKPQELYFAVQISLEKERSTCWDQEDVELDQIKTFVRSSSKGLAEVTRNKASEVQFIHETVRDFLLGKYEGQWSGVASNFVGHGHETLRDCCLAQLNASINQDVDMPDPLPQVSEVEQLWGTIRLKFPFLEYSVLNVLHHTNQAQQNAIEQGDFLANFPLQRWIFLNNTFERFDIRRYTESASLLYILAERNLANLIRIHPPWESCFDVGLERYGLPLFAALATGSQETVQAFLEVQAEIKPQEPLLHDLCKQYSENRNKPSKFDRKFAFSPRRSVFSYIAEKGDEVLLTFFCISCKFDLESKDSGRLTPLLWALAFKHEAVARILLEKGADPNSKDNQSRTPLSLAATDGLEEVVKLLLEKGADLESKDVYGRTPLLWAAAKGHEAVVKCLLEKDADIESEETFARTPLLLAAICGHEEVVKLLLEKDADLESKNSINGRTPLLWAAINGHDRVVKVLLKKGADLESKDSSHGQTPLSWAARNGHEAVVKLLFENSANLESKDTLGRTPLSWAASHGHEAVVKLLLEKGARKSK